MTLILYSTQMFVWDGDFTLTSIYFPGIDNTVRAVLEITCPDPDSFPTIEPVYVTERSAWLYLINITLTINNIICYHTYNFSEWTGGIEHSCPLIALEMHDTVIFINITFIVKYPGLPLYNPIVVALGDDVDVHFTDCKFQETRYYTCPLIYDNYHSFFELTNCTFANLTCFFLPIFFSFFFFLFFFFFFLLIS
jgi:hypothetical protein